MLAIDKLPRFTDLTLILTDRCNLSCPFCYVQQERARTMPREIAFSALDLLLERAPPGAPVSVSFFGGEPFLERALMAEVMARALERRPEGIRFSSPTNGTLLDAGALALVREHAFQLALSVDPGDDAHALARLEPRLAELREVTSIVRMTITPENVGDLFESIAELFARGFHSIMHQPALERPWPASARQTWREQHARLADWACERYRNRQPLPELVVLEGIVSRLERGDAPGFCGAGSTQLAVDPAGKIFGCFRSAYGPLVLADLVTGMVNEPLLAAYARLDPARARPVEGSCKACSSRDGCTVFCPAAGHVVCGDLRAVSADACALMQLQVESCREVLRRMRKIDRSLRRRAGAHVAAAALALGLAGGAAGCDSSTTPDKLDGAVGGVCPVQGDVSVKADTSVQPDGPVGGVCPVKTDTSVQPDAPVGGVCPVKPDAQAKLDLTIGPGVCPFKPDGPVGGVCPVKPDFKVKLDIKIGPGLCPFKPDGMTPGLC